MALDVKFSMFWRKDLRRQVSWLPGLITCVVRTSWNMSTFWWKQTWSLYDDKVELVGTTSTLPQFSPFVIAGSADMSRKWHRRWDDWRNLLKNLIAIDRPRSPVKQNQVGEENDWCQRAILKRYRNVVTPSLFVWHKHGASFDTGEKKYLLDNIWRCCQKNRRHLRPWTLTGF